MIFNRHYCVTLNAAATFENEWGPRPSPTPQQKDIYVQHGAPQCIAKLVNRTCEFYGL